MKTIVPIVQNVYNTSKILSFNDILLLLGAWGRGDAQLKDVLTKRQTLIRLLGGEGFSVDETDDKRTTALRHDSQGVEAYLSPNGSGMMRLTVTGGLSEYGIHPDYLAGLVKTLRRAGFRVNEVPCAERLYLGRPYQWEKPPGRHMLAGAKPYKS